MSSRSGHERASTATATTIAIAPVITSVFTLLSTNAAADALDSTPSVTPSRSMGTNATSGANMPARFRKMSSTSRSARMMIRHAPTATRLPTSTDCTGV